MFVLLIDHGPYTQIYDGSIEKKTIRQRYMTKDCMCKNYRNRCVIGTFGIMYQRMFYSDIYIIRSTSFIGYCFMIIEIL